MSHLSYLASVVTKDQTAHGDEDTHSERSAADSLQWTVIQMSERLADIGAFLRARVVLVEVNMTRHTEALHDGQPMAGAGDVTGDKVLRCGRMKQSRPAR